MRIMTQVSDFVVNLAFRSVLGTARALPYAQRVAFFGWVVSRVAAPLAGYNRRIRENLAYVFPDLPEAEVRRICREVTDNAGRTLAEFYSPAAFRERMARTPLEGPGLEPILEAHRDGRPAILVSGHFGNYQAARAALAARGIHTAGVYRPMNNRWFNDHYVAVTRAVSDAPLFARDKRGMAGLLRHLRAGGMVGMLIDQYFSTGETLDFLGKPAPTPTSAAELALRHDALLVPVYGTRQPDGLSFRIEFEAPVPHTDPRTMTQALNDSLARRVRAHMGQWLWIHRRWKPEYQRPTAAATTGP